MEYFRNNFVSFLLIDLELVEEYLLYLIDTSLSVIFTNWSLRELYSYIGTIVTDGDT